MTRTIRRKDCRFPVRSSDAHKGQQGRLLIVGGSESLVGAPILAAMAAFRGGTDIVEVAAPQKVAWAINTYNASIITHKLKCSSFSKAQVRRSMELAKGASAILIGNGLGRGPQQLAFVKELLTKLDKPLVIDADALHAVDIVKIKSSQVVCTPHRKELELLAKNTHSTPEKIATMLKEEQIILAKGPIDHIIGKDKEYRNTTGTPKMAVAGTGDVLAGLVAGFLAQGLSPLQSAMNAAYLNGKAGEAAQKDFGNFTAEELLNYLRVN